MVDVLSCTTLTVGTSGTLSVSITSGLPKVSAIKPSEVGKMNDTDWVNRSSIRAPHFLGLVFAACRNRNRWLLLVSFFSFVTAYHPFEREWKEKSPVSIEKQEDGSQDTCIQEN